MTETMVERVDDVWIEWAGGEYPPVKPGQWVYVRRRDGSETDRPYQATVWMDLYARHFDCWARYRTDPSQDIIAYKIYDGPLRPEW